jgi:hypothetical protein
MLAMWNGALPMPMAGAGGWAAHCVEPGNTETAMTKASASAGWPIYRALIFERSAPQAPRVDDTGDVSFPGLRQACL